MLLQTILKISTFVFLSSRQFCQVNGQCVDQAGVITNGKTCAQLLASDCYDATFLNNCCQTCKTFYTGVTGCEYGDKVANCVVSLCEYYSNPSECCVTCKVTTTAAPTTSTSATSTIPTLATTTKTPISTTPPTLAAITPTTSFIATTTQPTITTTPKVTLGATTATISKTIATVTAYTSTTSSLQVPMAPSVSIISQTTHTITLNVTLQAGSTVNQFEITASTGVVQKIPLPAGNVSVKYVFNVPNDSGTCFTLDIVATNAAGTSPVTTLSDACYAPLPPSVVIVTQTTTNITLNMTVPQGSLGNTFEVLITRAGTNLSVPLSLGGSRSIQYVLDTAVEAGSCFRLEVITIVTNNPIKSQATIFSDVCYAPKKPEVTVVTQTTSNVTLTVTLPAGSLGNTFKVIAIGGGSIQYSIIAMRGFRSIQHVVDIVTEAGTCFIIEAVTLVINNSIASDKTTLSNVCYAPKKPDIIVITQTISSVILNITLPTFSLGNTIEIKVTGGGAFRSVPLTTGVSRSVQHVFNEAADAGTCFSLEFLIVVTTNPIKSDTTTITNACYAPLPPSVVIVTQTTTNITLNMTVPQGSLGNTFEVLITRAGTNLSVPLSLGGSRSIKYVLDTAVEAGSCFRLEVITIVTNNPIKSQATIFSDVCYAPKKPEVTVVTQTTSNVTLTVTLPAGSLGNTFKVIAIGGGSIQYSIIAMRGFRSIQHVVDIVTEAGTCFIIEAVTLVINNSIASDKTTLSNVCYAPKKPDIIVITQTISSVILNITLPTFSLGNTIEIKVTGGGAFRSVPLTTGVSRSVQHVFNEAAEAGTCFSLEFLIVVTTNPIKSDTTTITNACYAPLPPSVVIVTQTTTNITLNMTVPQGSLGNTFEVLITRAGTNLSVPLSLGGSRSIQYVLDTAVEAGSCFRLEVITIVTNNPIKSQATIFSDVCYAPKKPEITVVTQTTSNVTLTVTLPAGSLGNTFKVIAIGGGSIQYSIIAMRGFRSIQHVVDIVTEAGTCFIIEAVTLDINNSIASDKTTLSNVCYAPKKPDIIVITQTISSVILNITLPTFSLGNTIEIKVTGGGAFRSVPLTTGVSRSVQHVFNEAADAGTCFSLEFLIVVTTNPIKSDTTTITNACYAPSKPEVNVVAQTTMNITMTITLPTESLGSSFEVRVIGGVASRTVPLIDDGSRSVQHVFNEVAKAGTCFSIEIFTLVSSNPIKSDTTVTSSCYVPLKPYGSVFEQAMDYIIFNMALQAGSTGKSFNVKVTDGKEYDLGIPEGSTDVQFAFNETGIPGTCFTLQVKTLSFGNVTESEASTIPNTCYAPKRPEVNVVETTITNIKLNISVASDSFAKSFQIRRTGETAMTVDFPSGNAPAFYLFDSPGKAGTCFTFEIVAIAADDRARSSVFVINNTCYASFPMFPGSLSAEEKMIVAVSSVGGLICVCGAAAVLCTIAMKMKKAQQNKKYSPPRHHKNHRLRSHRYGSHRKIPDYFGTYYPTHAHYYNHQIYNLDPRTNNGNIQDYMTSQVYN